MSDRITLEDALRAGGTEVPELADCPCCSKALPPFAIASVADLEGLPHDYACGPCILDHQRQLQAEQEQAQRDATAGTWEGLEGENVRATRNALLNQWAWTVQRGSPLSVDCQAAFEAFFAQLHRVTVDFPSPGQVEWPEAPVLEYQEN